MKRYRNTEWFTQNKAAYISAQKSYKRAVRTVRLQENATRDNRLFTILTDNPSSLFSYIKSSKNTASNIEKLSVGDKIYLGDKVADGFYDAMTALKSCNIQDLLENREISEQFSNYENCATIIFTPEKNVILMPQQRNHVQTSHLQICNNFCSSLVWHYMMLDNR